MYVQDTSGVSAWVGYWGSGQQNHQYARGRLRWTLGCLNHLQARGSVSPRKMQLPSSRTQQVHIKSQDLNPRLTGKHTVVCVPLDPLSKDLLPRHSFGVCVSCREPSCQVTPSLGHRHLETEGGEGIKAPTFPTSAQSETMRGDACSRAPCQTG